MLIKKNFHNNEYPFTIVDSYDHELPCNLADLRQLKGIITRILEDEEPSQTTSPYIATRNNKGVGGQMVRVMVAAYEIGREVNNND